MPVKPLDQALLDRLKLSPEVAQYLTDRGIPFPTAPPKIQTPSPGDILDTAWFDPKRVDRVMHAFMAMRHTQGDLAGKPLRPDPWQVAYIIAPVFGWVKRNDNGKTVRVVRKVFVDVPRKNGKTTMCGGLALYMLAADREYGAQVYAAAVKKDQAAKLFDPVKQIVDQSPQLRKYLRTRQGKILHPRSGSYFKVEANDPSGLHGANVHASIVDEIHVHKTPDLIDALETGAGSRSQPLNISITTADDGKIESPYAHRRSLIEQLAKGTLVDASYYGVVWAADEEDDPFAEATWVKANPGFPISPTRDFLTNEATLAKNSPVQLANYLRLYLGIRTKQATKYFPLEAWDACSTGPIDEESLVDTVCYAGLDLGQTDDLCAFTMLFPQDDGSIKALFRLWTPEANLKRLDKLTSGAATTWVNAGLIKLTAGNVADYDVIQADVLSLAERYAIMDIAYDRYGATQLITNLTNEHLPMTPVGMGYLSMSPLTKEFQRSILLGGFDHGRNPAIRWQADMLAVMMDPAGNVKPDRDAVRQSGGKMDGIVAAIMAMAGIVRMDTSDNEDDEFGWI